MSVVDEKPCFGFYAGDVVCNGCGAQKRCKAILVTNGFDLLAAVVEQMSLDLPKTAKFRDSDRMSDLVDQLFKPPTTDDPGISKEERELLSLLGDDERDAADVIP